MLSWLIGFNVLLFIAGLRGEQLFQRPQSVGRPRALVHGHCHQKAIMGMQPELRLLAAHAPPYNRRSRFPHRWWWVVLTDEAFALADRLVIMHGMSSRVLRGMLLGLPVDPLWKAPIAPSLPQGTMVMFGNGEEKIVRLGGGERPA